MLRVTFPREAIRPAKIIVAGHHAARDHQGYRTVKTIAEPLRDHRRFRSPTVDRSFGEFFRRSSQPTFMGKRVVLWAVGAL